MGNGGRLPAKRRESVYPFPKNHVRVGVRKTTTTHPQTTAQGKTTYGEACGGNDTACGQR
jgi:hypothetical protein